MKNYRKTHPRPFVPVVGLLLGFTLASGCASARFVGTGSAYPSKPENCEIEVFSSKNPSRDYEELGIIEGEGSLSFDTLEKVLPKMKVEACKAGGDALILLSSGKSVHVSGFGDHTDSDDHLNVTATVIRWKD